MDQAWSWPPGRSIAVNALVVDPQGNPSGPGDGPDGSLRRRRTARASPVAPGRGPAAGLGEQTEVKEDLLRDVVLLDAGDELHRPLTTRALKDVDGEDPLEQRGPIEAIR